MNHIFKVLSIALESHLNFKTTVPHSTLESPHHLKEWRIGCGQFPTSYFIFWMQAGHWNETFLYSNAGLKIELCLKLDKFFNTMLLICHFTKTKKQKITTLFLSFTTLFNFGFRSYPNVDCTVLFNCAFYSLFSQVLSAV